MDWMDRYINKPASKRWTELPTRIFLDTNVVQYLADFAECIFENQWDKERLVTPRGKVLPKGSFLYTEINCLAQIFQQIDRSPFHFALSDTVCQEVIGKRDSALARYVYDLWQYWQTNVAEWGNNAFQGYGKRKLARLQSDRSLMNGLSKEDFLVLSDALLLECQVVLTCDKYRNRQAWIAERYRILVLYPSDFVRIIRDFQTLWG